MIVLAGLSLLATSVGTAQAQGLGVLTGASDPGASTLVDRDEVRAAVVDSFNAALRWHDATASSASSASAERSGNGDASRSNVKDDPKGSNGARSSGANWLQAEMAGARERFEAELDRQIEELHADGVLTLAEISDSLPEIRQRHLGRFEDAVEAIGHGFRPPPLREAHEQVLSYTLAMSRYVVLERNPGSSWLRLLACVVGGLLLAALVSSVIAWLAKRSDARALPSMHRALSDVRMPLLLSAAVWGAWLGMETVWMPSNAGQWIDGVLSFLFLLFLFWACWNLCGALAGWLADLITRATGSAFGSTGRLVILRLLRLAFIVLFVLVATRFIVGASLTGILAGLGVAGLVLWFLLQGLIENLAASFTLFGDRSVSVGDTVIYSGQWGVIEDIGFRTTRFRTFDGHLITIPNSQLVSSALENVSRRRSIRHRFYLGIQYDTPPEKIIEAGTIIRDTIESKGNRIASEEAIGVAMQRFGPASLEFLVQYYARTTDYWESESLNDEINRDILARFVENDIAIAHPTQTTILETRDGRPFNIGGELDLPDVRSAAFSRSVASSGTSDKDDG